MKPNKQLSREQFEIKVRGIQTFADYTPLTARTDGYTGGQVKSLELFKMILGAGLLGESVELTKSRKESDYEKELGDVFWYAACITRVFNLDTSLVEPSAMVSLNSFYTWTRYQNLLLTHSASACEQIKKHLEQGHPINQSTLTASIYETVQMLYILCGRVDRTPQEILQMNMKKLLTRFPNGFSVADSIRRVDHHGCG